MKRNKNILMLLLILTVLLSNISSAPAMTLNSKNIIFHMDESSGSFYVQDTDPANKRLQNLLFNDNPPSSYVTFILNGKPFRLNSADFTKVESISQEEESINGRFYLDEVEFELNVFITNSSVKKSKDSVLLLVSVINRHKESIKVGSRFLLDTTYDEQKGTPRIYLDSTESVKKERLILKSMIPEFLFSGEYTGEANNFGKGLYIFPQVNSLSPESIIIGNWKKLDDTELDYKIKPSDQFRSSQYGSKDAAVAIFFGDIPVKSGEKVTFGIMLSMNQKASQQLSDITAVESTSKSPSIMLNPDQQYNQQTKTIVVTNTIIKTTQGQVIDPIVITNTIFVPVGQTNGVQTGQDYQKLLQSQIQLMEKMNNIILQLSTISNQRSMAPRIVTNIVKPSKDMVPKTEMIELRDAYEKQMKEVEEKYKALMEQQKREMETAISGFEDQLKDSTTKKNKVEAVNQLDQAIREMDQKIKVIEELEKLRLDFKTMPQEKLDALYEMLADLEKKLVKIQYQ